MIGLFVVLAGWILFGVGLCGWGWGVARGATWALKLKCGGGAQIGTLFWLGVTAALAVAQFVNFWLPLDGRVALGFWLVGFLGFADYAWKQRTRWAGVRYLRRTICLFAVPFLLLIAKEATYGPMVDDSGVYHFMAIRWAQEFPIVPGLGNLLGHLAFNQSHFLFTALFDVGPLQGHGHQLSNSLLAAAFICQATMTIQRAWTGRTGQRPAALLCVLLLPAVCYQLGGFSGLHSLSSPTPDITITLILSVIIVRFTDYIFSKGPDEETRSSRLLVICALGAAAITIKLSSILFVLVLVGIALGLEIQRNGKRAVPTIVAGFCASALLLFPWVGRGLYLSGYPAYPSTVGGLPVDWKVPEERVKQIYTVIQDYARLGQTWEDSPHRVDWFDTWRTRMLKRGDIQAFLFALVSAAAIFCLAIALRGHSWLQPHWLWIMPLFPAVAALGLWFRTAPDPRFLGVIPWVIPAWMFVWTCQSLSQEQFKGLQFVVLPLVAITSGMFLIASDSPIMSWKYDRLALATVPKAKLEVLTTESGLKIRVPVNRSDRRTWYAKLPTAPRLNPKLELRRRKLQDGFRISQDPGASRTAEAADLSALNTGEL